MAAVGAGNCVVPLDGLLLGPEESIADGDVMGPVVAAVEPSVG